MNNGHISKHSLTKQEWNEMMQHHGSFFTIECWQDGSGFSVISEIPEEKRVFSWCEDDGNTEGKGFTTKISHWKNGGWVKGEGVLKNERK